MNRKSLFAVVAFAVLGLVALFALRQPQKGEAESDRARPLAKIDANALDTLEVTKAGAKTTIKKDGDKYTVTSPVAYAADQAAAKQAFETIGKLELGDLVTENKAKQAEFEVDDAKGLHVVGKSAKNGDKVLVDVLIGKGVGNGTMVRLPGQDAIWQSAGGLRVNLDRGPSDWRDKAITTFQAADAELLTLKAKDGGVVIAKKGGKTEGGEDKWDLVTSVPKVDKLDNGVPAGVVSGLSGLRANDFADGAAPATTGLDAPALTVTVALKGGKNVTLLVGNLKGADDVYVKNADAPQVYLVKKAALDRVNRRPADFKDKTLCDLSEADLTEVAVSHGADSFTLVHAGTTWKATKPPKLELDPGKTPMLGGGFKDWKATSLAEDSSSAVTGLAKPVATVVAKAKAASCTLKIGNETKDKQGVYVQTASNPDVFVAPKWSVDRIIIKLDDLKKK